MRRAARLLMRADPECCGQHVYSDLQYLCSKGLGGVEMGFCGAQSADTSAALRSLTPRP